LLDTIIRDPLKQHIKKAAFIDIYEPPNEDIFSFFWWIAAIFPDPVGTLSAIQDAVHSGAVEKIILQNGCRQTVVRMGWTRNTKKVCCYKTGVHNEQ